MSVRIALFVHAEMLQLANEPDIVDGELRVAPQRLPQPPEPRGATGPAAGDGWPDHR